MALHVRIEISKDFLYFVHKSKSTESLCLSSALQDFIRSATKMITFNKKTKRIEMNIFSFFFFDKKVSEEILTNLSSGWTFKI